MDELSRPRRSQDPQQPCPVTPFMDILGGRWKIGILYSLLTDGRARFGQLQQRMDGITPTTLTRQLRELERDGLISRTQYNEIPPRVEYDTTDLVETLLPILDDIVAWVDTHHHTIETHRGAVNQS